MSGIVRLLAVADRHHCNMLTFSAESKGTGLELVKSQARHLLLPEELAPVTQLPGGQRRPAAAGLLKTKLA